MPLNAHQLVAEMSDRKNRNLAFFERYFPGIAKTFKNRELQHSRLNVDPNTLSIDLLVDDKPLYDGKAESYNHEEAANFSNAFEPGKMNHPLRHSYVGEFLSGRFFHGALEEFLETAGAVYGSARPYLFEHSLPQVVFLGSGFGYHIRELLSLRDVRHAILVEHDADRFLASLYVTDWEDIITPYIKDQTRSFTLSVGDTTREEESSRIQTAFAGAWNAASQNVPFLPVQTVLYVHQANAFYTKVANRFNKEIEPFINVWGYYDDEVNQLNHVLHNFEQKIPVFNRLDMSKDSRITLVCGNGPSLDKLLPVIKQHRGKINLISSGSTTHTLLVNDIYPDVAVTMESDRVTYQALTLLPKEKAKKIPVIGAAQIHPYTFGLFADALMYMKYETAYAQVFGQPEEQVANGTPSATNAALAVALDLKLPHIYLAGIDYGFLDTSASHAKDSFYHDKSVEQFKDLKANLDKEAYFYEENQFGKVYTTPFLNTARTHAQRKILESRRRDIINLSEGATIEGTEFKDVIDIENHLSDVLESEQMDLFSQLKSQARVVSQKEVDAGLRKVRELIKDTSRQLLSLLKELEPNRESIDATLFKMNESIKFNNNAERKKMAILVRGTLWHWLFNYYALTKQIDRQESLGELTAQWKQHFSWFLRKLPHHFDQYIARSDDEDLKLGLTIRDSEPNIEEWKMKSKDKK